MYETPCGSLPQGVFGFIFENYLGLFDGHVKCFLQTPNSHPQVIKFPKAGNRKNSGLIFDVWIMTL